MKRRETRGNFNTYDTGSRGKQFSEDRSNPFAINGNRRLPLSIEQPFDRPNLLFSPPESIRASLTNLRQSDLSKVTDRSRALHRRTRNDPFGVRVCICVCDGCA